VSADALTLSSLVLSMASGVLAALGHFVLAALFLLLSGACDGLDGVVARATSRATSFGALLDSTIDRLADGFPLLGVLVFYADAGPLVAVPALAMMGAFIVSYVRARAESLGANLPALYMRRAERVVLLVVLFLLGPLSIPGVSLPAPVLLLGVALLGLLSFAGAVSALRSARLALSGPRGMGFSEPSE
jgi:CDP-diacylglycerol--glycerol-3-phosphate 3-phosphatidyltransferase